MAPVDNLRQYLHSIRGLDHGSSRALPGAFYTNPQWTETESAELFARDWICCGRADEIPEPGDYFAFDLAGEPLVVLRDDDGIARAMANVCRHRGTTLVQGAGKVKRLVCPYHHWSYDRLGKLVAAPGIEPSAIFDPAKCRLPERALIEWMGFLFVSLSDDPPDLTSLLSPLADRLRNYHLETMRLRYLATETWDTNWKCLFENFMEGYHLSPLHRRTLHKVNPTRLCRHFPAGEAYLGYTVGFTTRVDDDQAGHPDLSEEERNTCVMFAVPPGLVVGVGSDYSSFVALQPDGPGRVKAKMGLYFQGDDWPDEAVEEAISLFQETMAEDKAVLLRLQQGVGSRAYEPGPLAPADLEGTCHDLHQYLARRLGGDPVEA